MRCCYRFNFFQNLDILQYLSKHQKRLGSQSWDINHCQHFNIRSLGSWIFSSQLFQASWSWFLFRIQLLLCAAHRNVEGHRFPHIQLLWTYIPFKFFLDHVFVRKFLEHTNNRKSFSERISYPHLDIRPYPRVVSQHTGCQHANYFKNYRKVADTAY